MTYLAESHAWSLNHGAGRTGHEETRARQGQKEDTLVAEQERQLGRLEPTKRPLDSTRIWVLRQPHERAPSIQTGPCRITALVFSTGSNGYSDQAQETKDIDKQEEAASRSSAEAQTREAQDGQRVLDLLAAFKARRPRSQ